MKGVELAKTVTELRAERQRLDDERRSAVNELTTTQQRLDELDQAQNRITVLETQLDNSLSQVRLLCFQRIVLLYFYIEAIRQILEYAAPVWI